MKLFVLNQTAQIIATLNTSPDGVFVVPTDTIYALSCRLNSVTAYQRILNIKQRSKPLIIIVNSLAMAKIYGIFTITTIQKMHEYQSGQITLIVPVNPNCQLQWLQYNLHTTVGIRITNYQWLKSLINAIGPIWGTSCNLNQQPPLNNACDIQNQLLDIDVIVDGALNQHKPSIIIDCVNNYKIIRH